MESISETEFKEKITKLRSLLFQFEEKYEEEKMQLLIELVQYPSFKPQSFQQFHLLLMAIMAYPSNAALLELTHKIMSKLLWHIERNPILGSKLIGTGLLHTSVECNFTFHKVKYLVEHFPNQVSIHSTSSSIETQKSVLKL